MEGHIASLHTHHFPSGNVSAEGFTFRLGKSAEQGDEELIGLSERIDVLLLKDDPDPTSPQHSNRLQAVHCVPGKSREGFGKNGVDPSSLAGGNHLVEIIPLF